jgi:hypothetical protein
MARLADEEVDMVPLTALWLPILLSAVAVFVWSSIVHMVLGYHRSDYMKLPDEEATLAGLRGAPLPPGTYTFPHAMGPKQMGSPAVIEKFNRGPVGMLNVLPNGIPNLGRFLGLWFAYSLVVSLFAGYLTGRAFGAGTAYMTIFRFASSIAFLAYASTWATDPIWKGQRWGTTVKHALDGLVYGLLTGGVFGWLWPKV